MGRAIIVPSADFSSRNLGTVTPTGSIPITSLSIIGQSVVNAGSVQLSLSFAPDYTTQKNVTWSVISGGDYAYITQMGLLVISQDAVSQDVVVRCVSNSNNSIYDEKTINVTYQEGSFVQKDYLQNSGGSYLILDDFDATDLYGATIESRGTITNGNGYLLAYRSDNTSSSAMRFAHYRQSSGRVAYLLGTSDFHGTTTNYESYIFRYVFTLSSSSSAKDASLSIYKGSSSTETFSIASGSYICYMSGSMSVFALGYTPHGGPNTINTETIAIGKFYGVSITKDGNTIANYVPGTLDGVPCLRNTVTGRCFFDATENNGLTAGND